MDVKICGICTPADAELAAGAGADWLGVILAPGRGRSRTLAEAADILAAGGRARRVGVFVDASVEEMVGAAAALRLDCVQLHGDEPAAVGLRLAEALGAAGGSTLIWKAIRVPPPEHPPAAPWRDVAAPWRDVAAAWQGIAQAVLLEGWSPAGHGGVGAGFDWAAAASRRNELPPGMGLVLAGGLNAGNVASAARLLRPDVVDVSSGVEASPGRKSAEQVRAFIAAARAAG